MHPCAVEALKRILTTCYYKCPGIGGACAGVSVQGTGEDELDQRLLQASWQLEERAGVSVQGVGDNVLVDQPLPHAYESAACSCKY